VRNWMPGTYLLRAIVDGTPCHFKVIVE